MTSLPRRTAGASPARHLSGVAFPLPRVQHRNLQPNSIGRFDQSMRARRSEYPSRWFCFQLRGWGQTKTYKYPSFWRLFTQLLFLLSIRLVFAPSLASSSSTHSIFSALLGSPHHNAIQHHLRRDCSPCFRLSGAVDQTHLLQRGELHRLGHRRQHRIQTWRLCPPHQRRVGQVNQVF